MTTTDRLKSAMKELEAFVITDDSSEEHARLINQIAQDVSYQSRMLVLDRIEDKVKEAHNG